MPSKRANHHIASRNGLRQKLRVYAAIVTLIAVGVLVTGCGAGSSNTGTANIVTTRRASSQLSSSSSTYSQALVYARCVRTHGVPLWPAPDSSGQFDKSKLTSGQLGVSSVKAATAQRACKSLIPIDSATQHSSQVLTAALRFSRCMRAHRSTNFPDPESNGAIMIPHAMESSPVYLAALHICIHEYGVPPPPSPRS